MVFLLYLVGVPIVGLLAFYVYRKFFCITYFKKLGVPGPEPHWFYGNLHQLWATDDRHRLVQSWSKKYGKFYGYYEGSTPVLVISSTEAVEQVCVKQFYSLPARRAVPFFPDPNKFPDSPFANISTLWGEEWKRLRTIANPGFSTGRLKAYSALIAKSQTDLEEVLAEKAASKASFEIFNILQCLALDVICEVAFGIELNSVKNRGVDNPILPKFQKLLSVLVTEPAPMKIGLVLPEIAPILQRFIVFQMKSSSGMLAPIFDLANVAASVMAKRRQDASLRRNDLLQLLIDATETGPGDKQDGSVLRPLSELEVTSQAIQFFGAGTNTTSATLSFACFILATNQDVQEKLYQEIVSVFPDPKTKPDYDTVMKMPYLDWFIHETVRMFPIGAFFVNRFATENTEVSGIPVKKELVTVLLDVFGIHHDPEHWGPVDPAKFHPERFSPDYPTTSTRPSSAFLGFGFGPRTCIGMRLALFEMKLTMITLLSRFRVLEREGGYPNGQIAVIVSTVLLPKEGVWVRLEARDSKKK